MAKLFKDGTETVLSQIRNGTELVQRWSDIGARMVCVRYKDSARMVQGWCRNGAKMIQECKEVIRVQKWPEESKDGMGMSFVGCSVLFCYTVCHILNSHKSCRARMLSLTIFVAIKKIKEGKYY